MVGECIVRWRGREGRASLIGHAGLWKWCFGEHEHMAEKRRVGAAVVVVVVAAIGGSVGCGGGRGCVALENWRPRNWLHHRDRRNTRGKCSDLGELCRRSRRDDHLFSYASGSSSRCGRRDPLCPQSFQMVDPISLAENLGPCLVQGCNIAAVVACGCCLTFGCRRMCGARSHVLLPYGLDNVGIWASS